MSDRLANALSKLLPGADICVLSERPWFSATFCGVQMSLRVTLSGDDHAGIVTRFTRELLKYDFDMPHQIAADIAVVEHVEHENETRLRIDALLLDD